MSEAKKQEEKDSDSDGEPVFWQNPHDHPLMLLYGGDDCAAYVAALRKAFGEKRSFVELPAKHLGEVSQLVMPLHFGNRDAEYFAHCALPEGATFLAFNHRFHDIASVARLMQGAPLRECVVPPGVQKLPGSALPDMRPVKVSSLALGAEQLAALKAKLGMTRNEVAFLLAAGAVARQRTSPHIMCLHSQRKALGAAELTGGDYSCYAAQFVPPAGGDDAALAAGVKSYFAGLRSGELVVRGAEAPTADGWMFDTWVGAGVGQPAGPGFQVNLPFLVGFYAFVCRDLVLAVDIGDTMHVCVFADDVELPPAELERWLK
jgi:hypothetical protein